MKNPKARSTTRRGFGQAKRKKLAGLAFAEARHRLGLIVRPPARIRRLQKKLGKRLKTLRKQQGLTPLQLAKDCGISTVKVERTEKGEVNVSLFVIMRLANRLGVTVADFFKGIE